ncbi:hypothetical protein C4D60_Mb01t24940 [Musa balbisiana]|uniref:Uncharacterized protein n=1 Tax=Musa balbisiana TaxID=52838 RepID=A0A4S8JQN7_MUSBA|nr:hypothetical protein C4D60_Mb01t24940 [Musa balbisiana]
MAAVSSSDDWLLHRRTATCIFVPGGIGRRSKCDTLIWIQVGSKRMDMIKYRANPDIQFIIFHTTVGSLLVEKVMFKELKQLCNGMVWTCNLLLNLFSCSLIHVHSRMLVIFTICPPAQLSI